MNNREIINVNINNKKKGKNRLKKVKKCFIKKKKNV